MLITSHPWAWTMDHTSLEISSDGFASEDTLSIQAALPVRAHVVQNVPGMLHMALGQQ